MKRSAEVVIMGAGVIGGAVAYFLAREGYQPLLVELGAPGAGTSSGAGGALALITKTPGLKLEMALESLRYLADFAARFEVDFEYLDHGSLMAAMNEKEFELLQAKVAKLRTAVPDLEVLDGPAARRYLPALSPQVIGAAISPSDASVNPLLLVQAYLHAACGLGAELLPFTEVQAIEVQDGRVTGVHTSQGPIATHTIVNAAGVWAKGLARLAGVDLPIVPRKGEIVVSEPTDPLLRGELFSASYLVSKEAPAIALQDWLEERVPGGRLTVGVSAGQTRRGTLLIGSTREFAGYDTRSTYRGMAALIRELCGLVPQAAELQIVRGYAGLRPATIDGLPIIEQHPDLPGFYIVAGHEGDGIALSAISGALLADLLAGRENRFLPGLRSTRFGAN